MVSAFESRGLIVRIQFTYKSTRIPSRIQDVAKLIPQQYITANDPSNFDRMADDMKPAISESRGDPSSVCLESALENKRNREHDAVFGEITEDGPDYRSVSTNQLVNRLGS